MGCVKNNCWKLIFFVFVCIVAYVGYRASHRTSTVPVSAAIDQHSNANSASETGAAPLSKEELNPIIKEFILNNPEVLIESIELMQQRKVKEMEGKVQDTIKNKKAEISSIGATPYAGNKDGDATVVVFYDYSCSYCKKANDVINQVLASDAGVLVIYKPLPILGELSEYIAKIMLALYHTTPDKFKVVHDAIMESKVLTKNDVKAILEKHGVKADALELEMAKTEVVAMQAKILELAGELRINGAPAFIIGEQYLPGLLDINQMKQAIEQERSNKSAPAQDSKPN